MRRARASGNPGPYVDALRRGLPALAAAAVVLGPAAGAAAAAPQEEPDAAVLIKDSGFAGKLAQVEVGETVTWTNGGALPHLAATTKAPVPFTSPKLAAGESWSFTFTKAGTYTYVCKLHPEMKAAVVAAPPVTKAAKGGGEVVAAAAATPVAATPGASAEAVDVEATAAQVDTPAERSTLILLGSLGAVLFLGVLTAAWPGGRS